MFVCRRDVQKKKGQSFAPLAVHLYAVSLLQFEKCIDGGPVLRGHRHLVALAWLLGRLPVLEELSIHTRRAGIAERHAAGGEQSRVDGIVISSRTVHRTQIEAFDVGHARLLRLSAKTLNFSGTVEPPLTVFQTTVVGVLMSTGW